MGRIEHRINGLQSAESHRCQIRIWIWPLFACQRNGRLKLGIFLRRFEFGFLFFLEAKFPGYFGLWLTNFALSADLNWHHYSFTHEHESLRPRRKFKTIPDQTSST
jgi:hypothetical protein